MGCNSLTNQSSFLLLGNKQTIDDMTGCRKIAHCYGPRTKIVILDSDSINNNPRHGLLTCFFVELFMFVPISFEAFL
jgi:hypothetical protein